MSRIANNMVPGDAIHPGVLLKEELIERGILQKDFAAQIDVKSNVLSELISGKRNFTPALSVKIEDALGIDAEIWMRLQSKYDIDCVKIAHKNQVAKSSISTRRKKAMITSLGAL